MTFIAKKFKIPKEGEYKAKVVSISKHLTRDDMVCIGFELDNGSQVRLYHPLTHYKGSLLWSLIEAVEGKVSDNYDMDRLIGENCVVTIKHRKGENGTVYANVTGIRELQAQEDDYGDSDEDLDDDSDESDDSDEEEASFRNKKPQKGMKGPKKTVYRDDDED